MISGTTHHVIADILGYNKVCVHWVPRMLTVEIMRVQMQISSRNLELYRTDPDKFLRRYVTIDETWAHHFDPETKQQTTEHAVETLHSSGQVSQGSFRLAWLWCSYFGTAKVFC